MIELDPALRMVGYGRCRALIAWVLMREVAEQPALQLSLFDRYRVHRSFQITATTVSADRCAVITRTLNHSYH
jgi:hypothetical protein